MTFSQRISKTAWRCIVGALLCLGVFFIYQLFAHTPAHSPEQQKASPPIVFTFASGTYSARVEFATSAIFISQWPIEKNELVVNGAYFMEDYLPAGFLIASTTRYGSGMFDQDKSGLVTIENGAVHIRDLDKKPIQTDEVFTHALQSYPFLIRNHSGALVRDTGKLAQRTAIGVDADGNAYVVLVHDRMISLYTFMHEILRLGIPFETVLNLDGGPSTGVHAMIANHDVLYDSQTPVSSILRFTQHDMLTK